LFGSVAENARRARQRGRDLLAGFASKLHAPVPPRS
jgi:hypothetical protein